MRLDLYLVHHKDIESRTKAQDLVQSKNVYVNSKLVEKPSFEVAETDFVEIKNQEILKYVSRAGLKLESAIEKLNISLTGKYVLDIGQSTGGFTDCCLQAGAAGVVGFDVGENQLHEKIKSSPKVKFFEKQNAKTISENAQLLRSLPSEGVDLIVCDVSFISLNHIVGAVAPLLKFNGEYLFLVKPQFECGPINLDKNGIVKNKNIYLDIQMNIKKLFNLHFNDVQNYIECPIMGKEGNTEFFIYGRNKKSPLA